LSSSCSCASMLCPGPSICPLLRAGCCDPKSRACSRSSTSSRRSNNDSSNRSDSSSSVDIPTFAASGGNAAAVAEAAGRGTSWPGQSCGCAAGRRCSAGCARGPAATCGVSQAGPPPLATTPVPTPPHLLGTPVSTGGTCGHDASCMPTLPPVMGSSDLLATA
jgi:hypothetical protein